MEYDQAKRSSGETREVDQTNSPEAIDRLSKIVDECLKLALRTGKPDVIEAAESAFSHVGKISIAPELEKARERPERDVHKSKSVPRPPYKAAIVRRLLPG